MQRCLYYSGSKNVDLQVLCGFRWWYSCFHCSSLFLHHGHTTLLLLCWFVRHIYRYICLFVFYACISDLPFFPSPGIFIDRLINITASLSHGLGGLQLSVQMLRIIHFFTARNREGKEKVSQPMTGDQAGEPHLHKMLWSGSGITQCLFLKA